MEFSWSGRRWLNLAGFLACAGLMGYALYSQHVLLYEPCPLCVLQRIAVIGLGVVFLVAFLHDPVARGARRAYAAVLAMPGLFGIGVAAWHVRMQYLPPGDVPACGPNQSLDDMLQTLPFREVLSRVFTGSGECALIDWQFLGLSMPAWVLVCVAGLLAGGAWNLLRR